MSSLAFLVTELQSLASETRRKHPEIREAAEKSLAILRASPEQATAKLASDGPQSSDLLRPVFMGCATKNPKVVAISLGSLQRLIALKAVPRSAVPLIINTMRDAMSQGVDIQLRILQTLVSLITNFTAIHDELLGEALLLCFKLQESKIAVVSSTAAATLRQLVMFVVDRMVIEDKQDDVRVEDLTEVTLPDETKKKLGPSSKDAYSVLEDLCLLANSEKPYFLKLDFLHKTFALELIESVLTNYHELFRKHNEFLLLLRHHLCPLLLKALSDRPLFPLTLRCTRVVFLLLKQFSFELETEAEVFLMLLIKIVGEDADVVDNSSYPNRPQWMRVLAMEILRGLCNDAELIRIIWDRYDAKDNGSKVFTSLVAALKRLVTEKPALLGVATQMSGVGIGGDGTMMGHTLDVSTVAGRVATAASATVSGVVGMMGPTSGLSVQGSSMKLQCIDQLDKADAPPIPESYIYLLAVHAIAALCEGFAGFTGPLYDSLVVRRPRVPGDALIRAPPALDLPSLPSEEQSTRHLYMVRDIIESGWPALLAALSFIIGTNLSDELFVEVLTSYEAMLNVAGMLGLTTPRDAFFTSLAKLAVPSRVVSSLDSYTDAQMPRIMSPSITENLGLAAPSQHAPGLSERNMACLKVFVSSALSLAGSLGESWYQILEALQNADYVLTFKGTNTGPSKRGTLSPTLPSSRSASVSSQSSVPTAAAQALKPPILSDLDSETLQAAIQRLFDASKNLEDTAFKDFINALCRLSFEMISMQSESGGFGFGLVPEDESLDDTASLSSAVLTPKKDAAHRRRVSGIYVPRTLRTGDFGLTKLGGVAMLNIHRLIYRSPDIAWYTTTMHLLSVIRLSSAPQAVRVQAARVLDEVLLVVPRNLTSTGDLQAQVQRRVLDVLAQQVVPEISVSAASSNTSIELRRMGLETLHQILQSSGHTLVVGWETIFHMLESVCRPTLPLRSVSTDSVSALSQPPDSPVSRLKPLPSGLGYGAPSDKGHNSLVKIAFLSLTLVCDSVSSLSPEHLRLCISTLGQFGRQSDTNIALTAAASLLWSVSDAIQAKRKNAEQEPQYSELWLFLLSEELGLCTDVRPEVRDGATQTLFRTIQLYGSTLSTEMWDQCIWRVTFPLLDALTTEIRQQASAGDADLSGETSWDESKILALQSIGAIFHEFLVSRIMTLESFQTAWETFVRHIQDSVLLDNRSISAPALRCLEKAIKASSAARDERKARIEGVHAQVWRLIDTLGDAVLSRVEARSPSEMTPNSPFTQESLVAFVNVIQCTRSVSRLVEGGEWQLDRLTRLMAILKGVLTYPNSPDYRSDIDALSPLQSVIMDTVLDINLSSPGTPSLVIRDMSEYATFPFLASFDLQNQNSKTAPSKVTYVALSKKAMPLLVDLYLRFKDNIDLYMDRSMEALLSAYSIPIKMKHDCPPSSKFGNDPPLWKTATECFLRIVKDCAVQMKHLDEKLTNEQIEVIWRQILDVFRGGILVDRSQAESFPLEVQEEEETFDLSLISALEIDVVPYLGDTRIPDYLVSQLGSILYQGSQLRKTIERPNGNVLQANGFPAIEKIEMNKHNEKGTTEMGLALPRERFSYWCFDLLFLVCSNTTKENELSRRRLATLTLPSLLNRCRAALVDYVADECLRGNVPFPRAVEEELLYVLRKLLELQLWPGTLWAALSYNPTQNSIQQPIMASADATPSLLVADAVKRSSVAHLFHFYSVLVEIASKPRRTPALPVVVKNSRAPLLPMRSQQKTPEQPSAVEVDARDLARNCLKEIGREMGIPY
ncbi:hypothetical protein F5887DRAFT_1282803 [Amanita rubescens]|nr:hypothetical protein F5887DRAFT_1282803 [Amanita rubescens]